LEPVAGGIRVRAAPTGAQAMARISQALMRHTSAIKAWIAIAT